MIEHIIKDVRLLLLTIATILLTGVSSFFMLPRMEDPVLTERAAVVNTRFFGADAERVESLVTDKLVNKLREFDEVKEIRSTSRPNISTIAITLKDEITEVDEIWARVRDKISDVRPQLPINATAPEFEVINVRAFASILSLKWKPGDDPVYSILRRAARDLEEELRNIPNTEQVKLFGDPQEEIVIEVQQAELARLGTTVAELSRQLTGSDAKVPSGQLRGSQRNLLIEVGGEFDSLQRIGRIPIRSDSAGQTVYLSDVATIRKGIVTPPRTQAVVDGATAIMVAVTVLPEVRIDRWQSNLEATVARFRSQLPPEVQLDVLFEQNGYVQTRMRDLVVNLIISAITVFAVVFLMMGWRSSIIVGLALPLSSCMVFAAFRVAEIPLHQMSLSGLVIALGMLEGTAIIIVDEVQRRLREGEGRLEAVQHGVSHMALPLIGSTATTILSFLPIATMPGPSGEFVGTIGLSVILALCCSLSLSFTVLPVLSALVSPREIGAPTFWNIGFHSAWLSAIYLWTLRVAFRFPWATAFLGILISLPGFCVLPLFRIQFFPTADRNQFHVELELSAQASIQETRQVAMQVRDLLLQDPLIERVDWVLGRSAPSFYYNMVGQVQDSPRYAQALVRTRTVHGNIELIQRLQERLNQEITSAQVRVRALEQGPPFEAPIEVRLIGNDQSKLREYGEHVRELLQTYSDVTQTKADLTDLLPKLVYNINEEEARLAGVDLSSIASQLDATLEGRLGGSVLEGTEEIPVRVRVAAESRGDLSKIDAIDLLPEGRSQRRQPISLSSLADATMNAEPAAIARYNGQRVNEVRAYLRAGVLPSVVLKQLRKDLEKPEHVAPPGCSYAFAGEASKRGEAISQLMANVTVLAAAMVFVLVFSLKSFRATAIIFMVGICSFGMAFFSLWSTGFALGFTAIVGTMGMVGIAINDSIVVLAELRSDPEAAKGNLEAILSLVMRSTRHVLSTTFTVGCSFVPMLIEGGTFWPPMAMVISGGVFGATVLALYWIPAVHILLQGRRRSNKEVPTPT